MKRHLSCCLAALILSLSVSFQIVAQNEIQLAQTFLDAHAGELGLQPGDYACLQLKNHFESRLSKVHHYYFNQCYQGIEVNRAVFNLHLLPNGEVLTWGNRFVSNLDASIQQATPVLSAADAVAVAAQKLGYPFAGDLTVKNQEGGPSQRVVFDKGDLSVEDIPVRLVYQPMPGGTLRLAWDLNIQEQTGAHWWSLRVDALDGQILDRNDWVISCEFGAPGAAVDHFEHSSDACPETPHPTTVNPAMAGVYNVYPPPVESPSHGNRQLVSDPNDPTASPYGWHDTNGAAGAEYTITRGNNVYAQLDDDNNNNTFGFAPDGGSGLVFDFPIDLTQAPSSYTSAAITNLFYWNNYMHDFSYAYGFDEASGNFQVNNYGNGGNGNDEVIADAQDSGGTNNANFSTPSDGTRPRMQMYLWTAPNPDRDGDLDNGIIAHEYAHGISTRQTGGPGNSNCLNNNEQMGEGWSDFYSLMTTMEPGDQGTDSRGIGTYALGQPPTGNGIRPTPYSTLLSINPTTYGDIGGLAIPHGVGYAWCTMIWEMTWGIIAQHGMTAGFDIAMNLVNEGLKLQPCSPGFVDGRNAILAADQALYGGANSCTIWTAFAKRGLGFSATQGSTNNTNDGVEAFDMPSFCTMNIQPAVLSICQPVNAVYAIGVGSGNGNVALSATAGVPTGANLIFSANPVASPGTSTMTIDNTAAIAPGSYVMTIEGVGSSTTLDVDIALRVHALAPAVPALTAPADNATGVILAPVLTWAADAGTDSFTVELASNAAFTTIVAADTLTGNTFNSPSLTALTQYWWRVKAKNACGTTAYSPVFTFTTANVLCMTRFSPNVPITIPSSTPSTVTSLLNMPIQGVIQDVNVKTLNINHTWIDDLIISLKSPANTSLVLMNRPCGSENNILINLDDEAANSNFPCPPTNNGNYKPYEPLTAVDSQNPLGPWTLTVQDLFSQDGGSIVNWGLEVCYIPLPTCGGFFSDSGGPGANYQNNENIVTTLCPDSPGQIVTVAFTAFSVQNGSDFLKIYDGADTTAPLIGTYTGTTLPGSFTSSSPSGCLTFRFTSNGSGVSSGWYANVTCCTPSPEICDLQDNDCDNLIDEGVQLTFYLDSDNDEFGDPTMSTLACSAPIGYVMENTDCEDGNPDINPNAAEICNLVDDDCDNLIDENLPQLTLYQDSDGDTYGDPLTMTLACSAPAGYVPDNTDCDDGNATIFPGATETCNLVDDDCDMTVDEDVQLTFFLDSDGDTYGDEAITALGCSAPTGYVADNNDCDDGNAAIYPGATELCNDVDDDCSGAPEATSNTWNGAGDGTNWSDAANWSDGIVPLPCQDVIVPAGFNVLVPAGFDAAGKTLDVPSSGQLDVQGTILIQY
ncbi:MAG: M36 family metallopeptidase [Lewinellaceae bacterium]|nr:M36 family metallopeptidase [Saprospiraceae bacterium]MCB9337391.1 M36 family metallopeptidase [Lewinellaceae bacterium]